MSATWEDLPNPTLRRVEMWCAREWAEAKGEALLSLAGSKTNLAKRYAEYRIDEHEWFAALLVVNRISLGIEPLNGAEFVQDPARERTG